MIMAVTRNPCSKPRARRGHSVWKTGRISPQHREMREPLPRDFSICALASRTLRNHSAGKKPAKASFICIPGTVPQGSGGSPDFSGAPALPFLLCLRLPEATSALSCLEVHLGLSGHHPRRFERRIRRAAVFSREGFSPGKPLPFLLAPRSQTAGHALFADSRRGESPGSHAHSPSPIRIRSRYSVTSPGGQRVSRGGESNHGLPRP